LRERPMWFPSTETTYAESFFFPVSFSLVVMADGPRFLMF